jgi:predicted AlkP superfamily pyrophosphatase or phosphodiesterase
MKIRRQLKLLFIIVTLSAVATAQNVVIAVIDGARYSETFSAEAKYIPNIWNNLRPQGTVWTNFRNEGLTKTDPGHATIASGVLQKIDNVGTLRSADPTIFEYFRKYTGADERSGAVYSGKPKLEILTYSRNPEYGKAYKASFYLASDDRSVFDSIKATITKNHPRIVIINFPNVDVAGHTNHWSAYLTAIRTVDSLVYALWQLLQKDFFYHNTTTLFVTNDHGRHDDAHGGFSNHGCDCDGCQHIMLLAIGNKIPAGIAIAAKHTQCDIAPTVGELLSFPTPLAEGISLLKDSIIAH